MDPCGRNSCLLARPPHDLTRGRFEPAEPGILRGYERGPDEADLRSLCCQISDRSDEASARLIELGWTDPREILLDHPLLHALDAREHRDGNNRGFPRD